MSKSKQLGFEEPRKKVSKWARHEGDTLLNECSTHCQNHPREQQKRDARQLRTLLEKLEDRTLLAGVITQVDYFDTWADGVIKSTDAGGITYHPPSGHLYIADSEINETPQFEGNLGLRPVRMMPKKS